MHQRKMHTGNLQNFSRFYIYIFTVLFYLNEQSSWRCDNRRDCDDYSDELVNSLYFQTEKKIPF